VLALWPGTPGPDGPEGSAIQSHPYLRITGEAPTGRIINFAGLLYNWDGAPFRVLSVRLISPARPGLRVRIRTLAPSLDQGGSFVGYQGDLASCPRRYDYRVRPVSRIVEPPHGESDWRLLVSVTFTRPGRYHLYVLKVVYVESGQRYWNYVRADITLRVVSAKTDPALVTSTCG
jgi:hypothetical protein